MKFVEYGKENAETIILLHGGGLSWWNYEEEAVMLKDEYHIILPVLDGHSDSETGFAGIEQNAEKIIEFIDSRCGGSVLLLGGLSLGGQILLEILSQRRDICKYAFVESALAVPMPMTYMLVKPAYDMCYGLIKHRWFSKLQFRSLGIKTELFEKYYEDTCKITKADMISFLKANANYRIKPELKETKAKVFVFVGEKELGKMHTSAKKIHTAVPESELIKLKGMQHGEFSINHADRYAEMIKQIMTGDR